MIFTCTLISIHHLSFLLVHWTDILDKIKCINQLSKESVVQALSKRVHRLIASILEWSYWIESDSNQSDADQAKSNVSNKRPEGIDFSQKELPNVTPTRKSPRNHQQTATKSGPLPNLKDIHLQAARVFWESKCQSKAEQVKFLHVCPPHSLQSKFSNSAIPTLPTNLLGAALDLCRDFANTVIHHRVHNSKKKLKKVLLGTKSIPYVIGVLDDGTCYYVVKISLNSEYFDVEYRMKLAQENTMNNNNDIEKLPTMFHISVIKNIKVTSDEFKMGTKITIKMPSFVHDLLQVLHIVTQKLELKAGAEVKDDDVDRDREMFKMISDSVAWVDVARATLITMTGIDRSIFVFQVLDSQFNLCCIKFAGGMVVVMF